MCGTIFDDANERAKSFALQIRDIFHWCNFNPKLPASKPTQIAFCHQRMPKKSRKLYTTQILVPTNQVGSLKPPRCIFALYLCFKWCWIAPEPMNMTAYICTTTFARHMCAYPNVSIHMHTHMHAHMDTHEHAPTLLICTHEWKHVRSCEVVYTIPKWISPSNKSVPVASYLETCMFAGMIRECFHGVNVMILGRHLMLEGPFIAPSLCLSMACSFSFSYGQALDMERVSETLRGFPSHLRFLLSNWCHIFFHLTTMQIDATTQYAPHMLTCSIHAHMKLELFQQTEAATWCNIITYMYTQSLPGNHKSMLYIIDAQCHIWRFVHSATFNDTHCCCAQHQLFLTTPVSPHTWSPRPA